MVCELFPHIGGIVDQTCIVRSMWTEQINHDPAHTFMNSGSIITGRPSIGSWVLYGLGAEADNLPGFVVLVSQGNGRPDAADRGAPVVGRHPAGQVPGRALQLGGRSGARTSRTRAASAGRCRRTRSRRSTR